MNREQLDTALVQRLQGREFADGHWSIGLRTSYLNEALQNFVWDTRILRRSQGWTITLVEGTSVYALSAAVPTATPILLPLKGHWNDTIFPLTTSGWVANWYGADWREDTGAEVLAVFSDLDGSGYIRVYPKPTAALITMTPTLYLDGVPTPNEMDDAADIPPFPAPLHYALVEFAAMRALEIDLPDFPNQAQAMAAHKLNYNGYVVKAQQYVAQGFHGSVERIGKVMPV